MSVRRSILLRLALGLLSLCWFTQASALPDNIVRIHYNRTASDYDGWGLHVWGDGLQLERRVTWGRPLAPAGTDGFGVYFDIPISESTQSVGFIVHKGAEKNVPEDMTIQVSEAREVWHLEGDPKLYYSRAAAAATLAPAQKPAPVRAAAERENARREAALKADLQALVKQAELDSKKQDAEALKKEEEAKQQEKEEQERMAAERDKVIAQLKAQRDANLARSEQDRFRQQQQELQAEMARRAELYGQRNEQRKNRSNRLSSGTLFGIAVGGGFALLVLIVVLVIVWQRRKPSYPKVMI